MCRHVANQVDELELGRDGRRGKVLHRIVNYWLHLLHVETQNKIRIVVNDQQTI
jgi:hypothetical protein